MTRKVILIILFFVTQKLQLSAKNYYFSSSMGNDNNSFVQAQKKSTPWKSLEKLKVVMSVLKPGDSVLFLRGDVFIGTVLVTASGTFAKPICFASYGNISGPNPEINGRINLSNWTSYENNIWVTDASKLSDKVNYFTINGKAYPMGRYPNANETPDGYLHVERVDSCLSITDNELKDSPNWTGAELVIKPKRWLIDRNLITKQEGSTIWYNSFTKYIPGVQFGYFIQNHLKTLDSFGEWYFDAVLKKLYLYLGDGLPENYNIQASRYDVLMNVNRQSGIHISGISFVGANRNAVSITNAKNIVVDNCIVKYAGLNGIYGTAVSSLLLANNNVEDVNNTGLYFMSGCNNTVIRNNRVKRCGIIDGTGPSGNNNTEGLALGGNNNLVEYNVLDSIGYIGLYFSGNDVLVKKNLISNFTMKKDDGGGIYVVSGKRAGREFSNRKIISNIVMNGIGNGAGTSSTEFRSAIGIYMDDGTNNVDILDNLVSNCAEIGIFLHDASFIKVKNNLSYNCDIPFAMHQDVIWQGGSMHDNEIGNNIFVSSMTHPLLGSYRTQENNVVNFGKFDNNYFWFPSGHSDSKQDLFKEVIEASKELKYTIPEWQKKYKYESNSSFNEIEPTDFQNEIRIEYNASNNVKLVKLDRGLYKDRSGKKYTGSIYLKPFNWVFLIKTENEK